MYSQGFGIDHNTTNIRRSLSMINFNYDNNIHYLQSNFPLPASSIHKLNDNIIDEVWKLFTSLNDWKSKFHQIHAHNKFHILQWHNLSSAHLVKFDLLSIAYIYTSLSPEKELARNEKQNFGVMERKIVAPQLSEYWDFLKYFFAK